MTIKNPSFADRDRRDTEAAPSPESTPESLPRGIRYGSLRGLWPGEINDGFEKAIREMRDSELEGEPPSWCQEWRE